MALAILASLMMSVSTACASGDVGILRRSSPAITSMPASGFFTSCAITAAISPTAASRSRSRSRSSSCSTRVRSLKNIAAPIDLAVVVAHERQRVADHLARRLQPHLGAVRQQVQLERAGQRRARRRDARCSTSATGWPRSSVPRLDAEDAVAPRR